MTAPVGDPGPGGGAPRIQPLADDGWTDRQREVLEPLLRGPTRNIYLTIARHPDLAEAMTTLGRVARGEGLDPRQRELLILRTGWNCRSDYEFAQHRRIGLSEGLSEADIDRVIEGPDAEGWNETDRLLCRLADELHVTQDVSDETWDGLAVVFGEDELLQALTLVGYYHLVSFVLNAVRVPLEDGAVGFRARG